MQGRSIDFLDDVLLAYEYSEAPASFSSINYSIGSVSYIENMEKRIFIMPYKLSFARNNSSYTELIRASLQNIAKRIDNDLNDGIRHNDFIQDHYADILKEAVGQLEKCGIRCSQIALKVEKLSWFVGGDPSKIKELQQNLNKLGIEGKSGKLLEDGVYGKETLSAWDSFLNKLVHGVVPILNWIDPLQSNLTGIEVSFRVSDENKYIRFTPKGSSFPYMSLDLHGYTVPKTKMHYDKYFHINVRAPQTSPKYQQIIATKLDHFQISEKAYNALKNFDGLVKKVKIGGKVLLVTGIVLDVLELGTKAYTDLNDADKKLGKVTASTLIRIGGQWSGAIVGAKLGAMIGAIPVPIAPVTVPILSIAGGIYGTFKGDDFAEWVLDITHIEE